MKTLALGALFALLVCSTTAFGQDLESKVRDLEKVVADQQKTISELIQRMDAREASGGSWADDEEAETSWFDRLEISGDLRYRHESIDDGREDRDRQRNRIRARLDLKAEVNDDVDLVFQLSTGSSATSGNQTLGDGWAPKGFYLARAAFDWHPSFAEGLRIIGGKMKRPFITPQKSELIWDGDLDPEGVTIKYSTGVFDGLEIMANLYGFWTVERRNDADSGLVGGQVAGKLEFDALDGGAHLFGGLGGFRYLHATDGDGTRIDTDDLDYHLYNGFIEFAVEIREIPFAVYVDYVLNDDADDEDTGWGLGLKVGKAGKPGQWEARYIYRRVEMNSVFPAFADSDFGGGMADAEGHEIGAKVMVMDGWALAATLFVNTTGIARGEDEERYLGLQLDLLFDF